MLTAVLVALAVASSSPQNAPSAASTATITDQKSQSTSTETSVQSIQMIQPTLYPGLDVHIKPIDPAGDLLPKLFSA